MTPTKHTITLDMYEMDTLYDALDDALKHAREEFTAWSRKRPKDDRGRRLFEENARVWLSAIDSWSQLIATIENQCPRYLRPNAGDDI